MFLKVIRVLIKCVIFSSFVQVTQQQSSRPTAPPGRQPFRRVCYFTNWSCDLLVKEAHFCLHHIDLNLCTHIIYAFAGINVTSLSLTASRVDDESKGTVKGRYVLFNDMKRNNTRLKTLLSVGGSYQTEMFIQITATASTRSQFAYNTAFYVRNWGFDGLDLDWEYPQEAHKEALTLLVQDLRLAFYQEAQLTGNKELILSLAAPASDERVNAGFQVNKISQHVDMINLMAYDFYGAWGRITGFNSPLYPRVSDTRFSYKHCVEWTVNLWVRLGAPAHKINLGIAAYGQSFMLDLKSRETATSNSLTTTTNTTASPGKISGVELNVEINPVEKATEQEVDNMIVNTVSNIISSKDEVSHNPSSQTRNCSGNDVMCTETKPDRFISNEVSTNSKRRNKRQSESGSGFEASNRLGERSEKSRGVHHRRDKAHIIDVDASVYGVGAKSAGPGKPGRLRHLDGQLSYPEICENTKLNDGHVFWDEEQQVPFVTYDDQWIGFDNVRSVAEKVKWAVRHNLGGVMLWSLDLDDFTGSYCGEGRFPLLSAISRTVLSLASPDPSSPEDSTRSSKRVNAGGGIGQSRDDLHGSERVVLNGSENFEQGLWRSNITNAKEATNLYQSTSGYYESSQDNATLLHSIGDIYGSSASPRGTPAGGSKQGSNGTRVPSRKHPKNIPAVAEGPSARTPNTDTRILEEVNEKTASSKNDSSHHRRRSGINSYPSQNDISDSNPRQDDRFKSDITENKLSGFPDVDLFDYDSGAINDVMNDYYYYIAFKAEPKAPVDGATSPGRTPVVETHTSVISAVHTTTTIRQTTTSSVPTTTSPKQTTRSVSRKRHMKDKTKLPASIRLNASQNLTLNLTLNLTSVVLSFILLIAVLL
ncbi:unnamed protein product [Lymnaea stagnalis]|uniref:GH18 domain-containing protein n=1 Tax=Lymnaea stagnalis TaxID=6523 RepID=A0AAV2IG90_LYMST